MKTILLSCFFLLSFAILAAVTWTGTFSDNWHTPGNWLPAGVPTITTDVTISNTGTVNWPRIYAAAAYCHNLQIDGGTNVHIYTNSLNVTGYLSVAGYITMSIDPCALYVQGNTTWQPGSQAFLSEAARVYCDGSMTFAANSQFNQSTGTIEFRGTSPTNLINHANGTRLPNVRVNKPWSAVLLNSLSIPATNSQDLRIGSLTNTAGSTFLDNYGGQIYLTNYISDLNTQAGAGIRCNAGTLITDGINESFSFASTGSYLNNLWTMHSGILSLDSDLVLRGSLRVWPETTVDANTSTIYIAGNWDNNAGPAAFAEETGTVVFNGTGDQYCLYSEDFHNLTLDKSAGNFLINNAGANITCASYTWLAGPFIVNVGTFTALDLAQPRILGIWFAYPGGTINLHQDSANTIDLCGELRILGGAIRIYGGISACDVADGGNALIEISSGVLDFVDNGIQFGDYLYNTSLIVSGGLLRTSGRFWDDLGALVFTGGCVELYNPASVPLKLSGYSSFYDLEINKGGAETSTVFCNSPITITHDLTIVVGALDLNGYNVNVDHNASVEGGLVMTEDATLDVAGHLGWGPSSWANTTAGTINCGGNWLFNSECTADLTGSINRLLAPSGATIYVGSPSAKFGNLELCGSSTSPLFICDYGSSGGQLNVGGYLAVLNHNTLDLVEGTGHVEGDTYIVAGGTLIVGDGGSFTTDCNLQLAGNLVTGPGTAIVHGMFYFPASGSLDVEWGIFRCDAPDAGVYAELSGALDLFQGVVEFTNLSVEIKAHPTRIFDTTNLYVGKNFRALETNSYQPLNGALHLTGSSNASLELSPVNFLHDLVVAKTTVTGMVELLQSTTVQGSLMVSSGILNLSHKTLTCLENVGISGTLMLDGGAALLLNNGSELNVSSGGLLSALGTATLPAVITRIPVLPGYYAFTVQGGGQIAASYAQFSCMDINGIRLLSGSQLDPLHCFDHCRFRDGQSGGTLLTIENNQELTIQWTEFPTNTWGGTSNVRKGLDQGRLTFLNYIGDFSGEAYDYDPFNRIDWGSSVPGVVNLVIHYDPVEGFIILDWEYGFPCDFFRIYYSDFPEGPWLELGTTSPPFPQYSDVSGNPHRFYYVTAVDE